MKKTNTRKLGKMRAERGVRRSAHDHESKIRRDTIRFLQALLTSPNGCASLDDATGRLHGKYSDGGRWRACIPSRLKARKLIAKNGVLISARTARHAGYLTEWRLIDRKAALRLWKELRAAVAEDAEKRHQ